MTKPYFIGISGESGVGKSTIASIIALYLGSNDTLRLSTDDLHKWERGSPNWDSFTHLNPAANNLELGDIHIADLAAGRPIYRSAYNHDTGRFDPPARIVAKKYILNEGLHAFYTDAMERAIDLKVFVDTDEGLRVHWKLIRDTEQRGYKYNSVIDAIDKRKADSGPMRARQIGIADVVIRLGTESKIKSLGCKREDIILTIEIDSKGAMPEMFEFIKRFVLDLDDFVRMSKAVSGVELCQNNGGNISVKTSDSLMIIKASGFEMKDIHGLNGHSVVWHPVVKYGFDNGSIKDDRTLTEAVGDAVPLGEYKRPSMETGFHSRLGKYVVHTHPVYLNALLCLEDSRNVVAKAFAGWDYKYVDYQNPGFDLCWNIRPSQSGVYFLANHGLIVTGDDMSAAVRKTLEANELAKSYMAALPGFREFSMEFADAPLDASPFYPDSAVFLGDPVISKREILAAHNYISHASKSLGKLRLLGEESVSILRNMESEKYRRGVR